MDTSEELAGYRDDERALAHRFFETAYATLLKHARMRRRRAGFQATMLTEDLLQETFIKVCRQTAWQSQEHFLRCVSLAMRQVVVDHARRRLSEKRGLGVTPRSLDDVEETLPEFTESPEQIIVLNDLLNKLEQQNPRWLRIVDARYFAGMTEPETAAALGLSERTVRRDWQDAREWLFSQMNATG
jgi:RNA polymerase sigma factor (TIGR02999 family)